MSDTRVAITIGEISRRLDEPLHRVEYAIRPRNIQPNATAGNLRIFDVETIERVAGILREIDLKRAEVRS
jgi:hypothetical protein